VATTAGNTGSTGIIGQRDRLKATAAQAGYASASAFIAAFRKTFGTTPGSYFSQSN
jgi:AraC-like DNA-binding protein